MAYIFSKEIKQGYRGRTIKQFFSDGNLLFIKVSGKGSFPVPSSNSLKSITAAASKLPMFVFSVYLNCHHNVSGFIVPLSAN